MVVSERSARVHRAHSRYLGREEEARHDHDQTVVLVQGVARKEPVEEGRRRCDDHLRALLSYATKKRERAVRHLQELLRAGSRWEKI
jgi:hypothetical protein